jgi:hypothetical protein
VAGIMWDDINTLINNVAEEVIGKTKERNSKDWFDEECKEAIKIKNVV